MMKGERSMNKEVAMELRRRLQIKGALRFEDITNDLLEPSFSTAGKSAVCAYLTPC